MVTAPRRSPVIQAPLDFPALQALLDPPALHTPQGSLVPVLSPVWALALQVTQYPSTLSLIPALIPTLLPFL